MSPEEDYDLASVFCLIVALKRQLKKKGNIASELRQWPGSYQLPFEEKRPGTRPV